LRSLSKWFSHWRKNWRIFLPLTLQWGKALLQVTVSDQQMMNNMRLIIQSWKNFFNSNISVFVDFFISKFKAIIWVSNFAFSQPSLESYSNCCYHCICNLALIQKAYKIYVFFIENTNSFNSSCTLLGLLGRETINRIVSILVIALKEPRRIQ